MGDSSQKKLHVYLLIGLLPCNIYFLAILPIQLTTAECFHPIIHHIFEIFQEVEIFLPHFVVVLEREGLAHEQLVSVLIERHHEEG